MDGSGQNQVTLKRPRRSVQSKLSFSASSESRRPRTSVAPLPDAVVKNGGRNSEGRENKVKRKRNEKLESQDGDPEESAGNDKDNDKEAEELNGHRKKSTRNLKNKQSGGKTPRKSPTATKFGDTETSSKRRNLNGKSENVKDSNVKSQPFSDLWFEAKKAAEETLRLSAGKQTHPFFSICRATNRLSETKDVEKSSKRSWLCLDGDCCISFPPFHVLDAVEDDDSVPNWENWKFLDRSLPRLDGYCSMKISSIFEVSAKSLLLEAACGKDTKLDNVSVDENINGAYETTNTSEISNELLSREQIVSPSEMVHVGCNFSWSSTHGSIADDLTQDKTRSRRLSSYSKRDIYCTDCSLWTEKYRPKVSQEVCGNADSVKLLSEWLKSWEERVVQKITNGNGRNGFTIEDNEYDSYDHESDTDELDSEDSLKNVLLITGPVGSGKSSAIYACAREQGFKVIEVNASSLRNGAYVRQTFGEGVESLGLTRWLAEDQTNQQSEDVQDLQFCVPVIAESGLEADSIKMDTRLFSMENAAGTSSHFHTANKTLFLFEEVDVVFDEDHGFISTIFKLAETTKRPIILTSNTKRPVVPNLLDLLVLDFKAPSCSDLLYHASMVCAFEKVHVSYVLLAHIIKACVGDLRRILLLLQFWCQGFRDITEKTIQCTASSVPFDIDAAHLAISRVIPWDFRCELSEKVEEEISKAVSALEEKSFVNELLQHNVQSWEIIDPLEKLNATTAFKSSKKRKLRKQSIVGHIEFLDHMNHHDDLLYDPDSPSTCFQRNAKQKHGVVLSSESDDGPSSDDVKPIDILANHKLSSDELSHEDISIQANGYKFLAITTSPTKNQETYGAVQLDQMDKSRNALVFQNSFDISEVASISHVCDASRIHDANTCMSESSPISGTETNMNVTFISQEVTHNSGFTNLFDMNISPSINTGVDLSNVDGDSAEFSKRLENHVGKIDVHMELLQRNQKIGCFQNEEHRPSECLLLDDCNHPDFSAQSLPRDSNVFSHEVASISKTWRRLWSCRHENPKLLSSNSKDVSLVASLTSGLVDMISEADIMFSSCNPIICDNFEPTSAPFAEPDSFSWYDEQVEMGSTFAQHGLCFYVMKFDAVGSCLGCNDTSDLAQEMLSSSTGSTALGKLLIRESITGQNSCFKDSGIKAHSSLMPIGRESAADLYDAILPIVPARLSMVLKGVAFHEYLSYAGQISRFETSRLAESLVGKQQRRSRTRLHYLSSGAYQLSSGQAELLARKSCFTSSNSS